MVEAIFWPLGIFRLCVLSTNNKEELHRGDMLKRMRTHMRNVIVADIAGHVARLRRERATHLAQ
jgi:hypothetical protein